MGWPPVRMAPPATITDILAINAHDRMLGPAQTLTSAPVAEIERISALDVLRGVALLGILLMNIQLRTVRASRPGRTAADRLCSLVGSVGAGAGLAETLRIRPFGVALALAHIRIGPTDTSAGWRARSRTRLILPMSNDHVRVWSVQSQKRTLRCSALAGD
ncbi:MAG: hypothetical protein ACRENP_20190 [Longimicrobiales bacterium]